MRHQQQQALLVKQQQTPQQQQQTEKMKGKNWGGQVLRGKGQGKDKGTHSARQEELIEH
jgi:hypothetical protein